MKRDNLPINLFFFSVYLQYMANAKYSGGKIEMGRGGGWIC